MTTEPVKMISVNGVKYPSTEIKGIECVFSTYSANPLLGSDMLITKEKVHFHDGRILPNMRMHKDKKWPFYITREGFRNHNDKKEWEDIHKLERRFSTRINLPKAVARALNGGFELPLKKLSNSPYLYGTDALPSVLMKEYYERRWPDCKSTTFDVAALDNETDIVDGTGDITISNICFKDKAYTAVTEQYVDQEPNFIEKAYNMAKELMGEDFKKRDLKWEIEIVPNAGEAVYRVLQKAHEWKPDFISIWNMNFDIPEMIKALEKYNYDVAEAFSDPSVPEDYRVFNYREGSAIKKTQSGKTMSLHHADRWHVCTCSASFYFIDSMCLYKRIRTAQGNESSYKLDYILKKNGLASKLKIKELENCEEDGTKWHTLAQKHHRIFYCVYNLRDDLALLDLDESVGDICRAFPALAGISDYATFTQQPRKIVDDMHFFVQDRNKIIGTTGTDIANDPLTRYCMGLQHWIITLPAHMIDEGAYAFKDAPNIKTMIYRYLAD